MVFITKSVLLCNQNHLLGIIVSTLPFSIFPLIIILPHFACAIFSFGINLSYANSTITLHYKNRRDRQYE